MQVQVLRAVSRRAWQSPNDFKTLYNNLKMVAVKVPTVDKRKRIPQKAIDQVVEQIVEKFKPQKIILFGSYARGNPRPESDVDMLVVMNTSLKEVQQAIQICQQIEYRFGLDLIVHTPKYLAERVKMGDWFLRDVLKEGKVLYESNSR
jgi:predicted nucleotidyltransferase